MLLNLLTLLQLRAVLLGSTVGLQRQRSRQAILLLLKPLQPCRGPWGQGLRWRPCIAAYGVVTLWRRMVGQGCASRRCGSSCHCFHCYRGHCFLVGLSAVAAEIVIGGRLRCRLWHGGNWWQGFHCVARSSAIPRRCRLPMLPALAHSSRSIRRKFGGARLATPACTVPGFVTPQGLPEGDGGHSQCKGACRRKKHANSSCELLHCPIALIASHNTSVIASKQPACTPLVLSSPALTLAKKAKVAGHLGRAIDPSPRPGQVSTVGESLGHGSDGSKARQQPAAGQVPVRIARSVCSGESES